MFAILLGACLFQQIELEPTTLQAQQDLRFHLDRFDELEFLIPLQAGDRVEGGVWQRSVDVSLSVVSPAGQTVDEFDYFHRNVDPFRWRAETTGTYLLKIRPTQSGAHGFFDIRLGLAGKESDTKLGQVQQYLNGYFDQLQGTQIAIIINGELVFSEARGTANLEYEAPMTLDTPCRADILLRHFTHVGILRMVDANLLTLDTPVKDLLQGIPDADPPILVRHLMQKKSGLPDTLRLWRTLTGDWDGWPSAAQQLALLDSTQNVLHPAGTESDRGDVSELLLQEIIDRASRNDFPTWVGNALIKKVGMSSTQVLPADTEVLRRAKIYGDDNLGNPERAWLVEGQLTAFTTMEDWILWIGYLQESIDGEPSYWDRLQEFEIIDQFSHRHQAGFLYNETSDTWILELRNAIYLIYPEWAMEGIDSILHSQNGWVLNHPGDTMGLGTYGGRSHKHVELTKEEYSKWQGRYLGTDIDSAYFIVDQGGTLYLQTPSANSIPIILTSPTKGVVRPHGFNLLLSIDNTKVNLVLSDRSFPTFHFQRDKGDADTD